MPRLSGLGLHLVLFSTRDYLCEKLHARFIQNDKPATPRARRIGLAGEVDSRNLAQGRKKKIPNSFMETSGLGMKLFSY